MKKILLSLTILLAAGLFTHQAQAQSNIGFGFRGGVNIANINDADFDAESRTGIMLGGYFSFPIPNSPVYIQPEILYTQKGAEIDDLTGNGVTTEAKLDYIEVPVLARFDFITDGNITPHVYFGPYIGFNVSSEVEATSDEGTVSDNLEDEIKGTDFGVTVGGGVDFGKFNLGVRYGAGLTKIFEDDLGEGKNGVFSVTAGVNF